MLPESLSSPDLSGILLSMTEQEAIGMQHGEFVKSLYSTLYNAYITTTDPAEIAQAEQKFIAMVTKARDARARALALLAQGGRG